MCETMCMLQELNTARVTVQALAEVIVANDEDPTVRPLLSCIELSRGLQADSASATHSMQKLHE